MMRSTQLYLTSHLVFVLLLLLLLLFCDTSYCYGASSNSLPSTKELLSVAIKEYNTIMDYLAQLLHILEVHGSVASTNSTANNTTSFHYSTVKRIPYPINIHPLLPYQPSASDNDVSSPSTSPTSLLLPFGFIHSQTFTTVVPNSSIFTSNPVLQWHPSIHTSSSTPTSHIILHSVTSTSPVSLNSLVESHPITPTFTLPINDSITFPSSTASSYKLSPHDITSLPLLPSLTIPTAHPHTHNSSTYPLLSHSQPSSASHSSSSVTLNPFKYGEEKNTEEEYFDYIRKDSDGMKTDDKTSSAIQGDVPQNDTFYTTERRNTSLTNKEDWVKINSKGDEEKLQKDTIVTLDDDISDPSEGKILNSRRKKKVNEKEKVLTENPLEKTAEIILSKESQVHIIDVENQDKEAKKGEKEGKEKKDMNYKKYKTRSITENKNDEVDTNNGKKQITGTERNPGKEDEQMKNLDEIIKKNHRITILRIDNTKSTEENLPKNENYMIERMISKPDNDEEEEREYKLNEDERTVTDEDEQSKEWLEDDSYDKSTRKKNKNEKKALNHKKGERIEEENITDIGKIKEKLNLFLKEINDKKITDRKEEREEDAENNKESNKPDKNRTENLETDKEGRDIKIQRSNTDPHNEDEIELQQKKKKINKIPYNHQESEDTDSLQIKKKLRGIHKQKHIAEKATLHPTKPENKKKHRDDQETTQSTTPAEQHNINTNTPPQQQQQQETKEHNTNTTQETTNNNKNNKHRKTNTKEKKHDGLIKLRKQRHILDTPSTTTTQPPPHLCTKDTPQTMLHLCTQLFNVLLEVEDVIQELVRDGVRKVSINKLHKNTRMLGEVLEKVEAAGSIFSTVDHQLLVSYLHRLDQTVMKAKQQLEIKLTKHDHPSLMVLVALGVGGSLVVVVVLVTVVLIVVRRRQIQREEIYRKQICAEQIPIQSFLESGHSNPSMREDGPQPASQHDQDVGGGGGGGGGCHGPTQEGHRRSKGSSTFTTTFNSTTTTPSKVNTHSPDSPTHTHAPTRHTVHPDTNTQSHRG